MNQSPEVISLTPVVATANLHEAIRVWSELLGAQPTFVDGTRWAQFDLGHGRLALAGNDRVTQAPAVMLKVADVEQARARAIALSLPAAPLQHGPHEVRCLVQNINGWDLIFYAPTTR